MLMAGSVVNVMVLVALENCALTICGLAALVLAVEKYSEPVPPNAPREFKLTAPGGVPAATHALLVWL